jgi:hypothetical protein
MLMMWPSAPRQCRFCHSAGTVVPAVEICVGAVVRGWRCQACDRHWALSPCEQQACDRRTGPVDRRRTTRADRRARKM